MSRMVNDGAIRVNDGTTRLQWKRFAVFGLCYFCAYTSFRGLRDLQSTINSTEGLGPATLAVAKISTALAGLVLPTVIRLKIGTKWGMVLGTFLFTLYTASNYYPVAYLLLTVAPLAGIGDALMWVCRGTYVATLATELAAARGRSPAVNIAFMTGIFSSVSRMSTVCGNIISFVVLNSGLRHTNDSLDLGSCGIRACGAGSLEGDEQNGTSALVPPDQSRRTLLISVYLGVGVLAVVVALVFLERIPPKPPPRTGRDGAAAGNGGFLGGVASTFRLMRRRRMILMMPPLFLLGADVAFISEFFTKFFVGCTYGIEAVGFVMTTFYLTGTVLASLLGRLIKYTGRAAVYITGASVYVAVLIVMLVWNPETAELWHLFLMASSLGIPRAALSTVTETVLAVLFPDQKEAAFGNLCFWQAIGFASISALGIPETVCAVHVVPTILGLVVVVLVVYIVLEVDINRQRSGKAPEPDGTCDKAVIIQSSGELMSSAT